MRQATRGGDDRDSLRWDYRKFGTPSAACVFFSSVIGAALNYWLGNCPVPAAQVVVNKVCG